MTVAKIARRSRAKNPLIELNELVKKQGYFIGQEIFFKAYKHKERVVVIGYTFELSRGRLELSYSVEDTQSVSRWMRGELEEPSRFIATPDQLCVDCDLPERKS